VSAASPDPLAGFKWSLRGVAGMGQERSGGTGRERKQGDVD